MRKIYLSFILCLNLYSQTNEVNFDEISVTANEQIKDKRVGERKIDAETINKQQVTDSRDLVRYETGVSVVETGRMGASGYAIRGVDENRVGITIDGLRQAETLSSQGFKELFEGYGNFNNTRNGIEMENVKMATITKGADSVKSGSGALGGGVSFETKDAKDFLIDKNYHFSFKNGFQSVDDQKFRSITAAAKFKWFDVLIVNTQRNGHEHKNYFYNIYESNEEDRAAVGKTREKADPYDISRKSTLVKIGFEPFENQRFGVAIDNSRLSSQGQDLSYVLNTIQNQKDIETYGERKTNDKSTRKNVQYTFESFTQTPFWDSVKISYSNQRIKNKARTDDYCSGDKCVGVRNNDGLKLDDSSGVIKVVDSNGNEVKAEKVSKRWSTALKYTANGKELSDYREANAIQNLIDCSKLDCSKKFRVFVKQNEKWEEVYKEEDRSITTVNINGKKYGKIDVKRGSKNGFNTIEDAKIVVPKSEGYSSDNYNDRDLNTDTKQFNIDFDKEFELLSTEHFIKYGAMHAKTKKSMVNADGYMGQDIQWWQDYFIPNIEVDGTDPRQYKPDPSKWTGGNPTPRHRLNFRDSYLIPVETKESAVYVGDYIKTFEWLGLDLNYRYDKVAHNPSYDESVPVPKGLILGIMKSMPCALNQTDNCKYNSPIVNQNFAQNLALLLRKTEYKSNSYNFGVDLDPLSWLRVQLKYSKGFRAPTSDEVYMTFKHPSFSIAPNTNLKAEIAKTKELAVTFHNNNSFATFNFFKTDYTNFIDLVYIGRREVTDSYLKYPFWQNINRDSAEVKGFEVNSRIELGDISDKLKGFRFGYKFTRQKGKMNGDIPMNAIQPTTSVYSIGYSTPDDKYGIDFFLTDVSAKKAEDTYNMYWKQQAADPDRLVQGKRVTDSTLAWRSGAYKVFDMIAYAKPTKNFSFGFGVYNITDAKYMTWDKARSIRAFGTTNLIDQNTGAGIGRFYAPRRNFRFSWEITF
ncbi:TonB-dependent hemoglobin/transferrin/lactoferrin receptor family protein [Campylobacter mucosalis]|uniref:TonB-dependent hemoglobin/transferrin/lactoferrin family receptor n=1 Tax=Campylobacter mucosalis TaxID=202 RepID=UPI001594BDCC|nr:TonB-dependent hemoglobin/transferrin/lactoferrin family receptor [Campylobacter mucosalis]QKF62872.1 TonB-dependent hemoglobin/transferrin/lactoferrin receptor family protein [Campylobacter mucosalis]